MPLSSKPEESRDALSEQRRACRKQALGLLARREHSRLELRRKLLARSYPEAIADEVLDILERERLLVEARFVEQFVNSRASRGQGPARIRAELMQRGIGDELIDTGLGEAGHDWTSLAGAARRKRFGPAAPADYKERARQTRFLRTRGFEFGQIQAALDLKTDTD